MNTLPKVLEDIIMDYKNDLELMDTRNRFTKTLNIIKQYNHCDIKQRRYQFTTTIIFGPLVYVICDRCNNYVAFKHKRCKNITCKCP